MNPNKDTPHKDTPHTQGLLVFPLFDLVRLRDILGQNDLLGNLIKLSPKNLRSPEN